MADLTIWQETVCVRENGEEYIIWASLDAEDTPAHVYISDSEGDCVFLSVESLKQIIKEIENNG